MNIQLIAALWMSIQIWIIAFMCGRYIRNPYVSFGIIVVMLVITCVIQLKLEK